MTLDALLLPNVMNNLNYMDGYTSLCLSLDINCIMVMLTLIGGVSLHWIVFLMLDTRLSNQATSSNEGSEV